MAEDVKAEMSYLKYELIKKERDISNLEKGYDRRKKLKILSEADDNDMMEELRELRTEQSKIKRRILSLESQQIRSRMLDN